MIADTVIFLSLVAVVTTQNIFNFEESNDVDNTAYGYHSKIGIPVAEKIRNAETQEPTPTSNIILVTNGNAARLGEVPYQAGILADLTNGRKSACGGSLLNSRRVLTAAHCWFDGVRQSWQFTVVLGSITLFSGGQRIDTSDVISHTLWTPRRARHDIAMIKLPEHVSFNENVAPIALPSRYDLKESLVGCTASVSGFGATRERGKVSPTLNFVSLPIISNAECAQTFPMIKNTNVCTSGAGGKSSCGGDSGGPLAVWRNGRTILIGITSFGHSEGCTHGHPVVFTRVSAYLKWINGLL